MFLFSSAGSKTVQLFVSDSGDKILLYFGNNEVFLWETSENTQLSTNGMHYINIVHIMFGYMTS